MPFLFEGKRQKSKRSTPADSVKPTVPKGPETPKKPAPTREEKQAIDMVRGRFARVESAEARAQFKDFQARLANNPEARFQNIPRIRRHPPRRAPWGPSFVPPREVVHREVCIFGNSNTFTQTK